MKDKLLNFIIISILAVIITPLGLDYYNTKQLLELNREALSICNSDFNMAQHNYNLLLKRIGIN